MNQEPTTPQDDSVSTESQRIALERMSAELVHSLNVMIAEQEERVRIFAEQHHSPSPLPRYTEPAPAPEAPSSTPQAAPEAAPAETAKFKPIARRKAPPLPAVPQTDNEPTEAPQPQPFRVLTTPRRSSEKKEEGSIGVGTIVTGIVIILILLRACS